MSNRLQEIPLAQMGDEDVSVEMLASPVNPVDVNVIQGNYCLRARYGRFNCRRYFPGVYPIKPPFPAVGGGEGVGIVTAAGSQVTSLRAGDWVIPALPRLGQ